MDTIGLSLKNRRQIMVFEFESATVYDTVGSLIQASKQCRKSIRPRGVRNRISYRLHDVNGRLVSVYTSSGRGWVKSIAKDMYRTQTGFVESTCYPHPV